MKDNYLPFKMTEHRRELILRTVDGESRVLYLIFLWHDLARVEEILHWLIDHRFTGKALYGFMQARKFMPMAAAKEILMHIDKERELRPILVGRDYKPN